MAYSFFIDKVQFPVAPSKFSTKIKNQNTTITLINEGEVNLLKQAGLTELSFELLLPNIKYPFAVYPDGFKPATYYLKKLKSLKVDKKPFQFLMTRMKPDGNLFSDTEMIVSLEEYEIKDDHAYGFDMVVQVQLKQYREYGTKVVEFVKPKNDTKAVAKTSKTRSTVNAPSAPKSHKVVKGDTLWAICKKYLGDPTKYPEIAKKNNIKNPNLIYPGQIIKF
ncbi:LysM peptidoglycan-binding domain-containing protein [Bacillus sp. Bva_UNVM-123]|uniref:LysM peptidoglycan-binding domain-containing protein n=1 Tax=Bacillus sp. Bva_UNVM-123 TaxID=2829798 RepID=UPI00391F94A3